MTETTPAPGAESPAASISDAVTITHSPDAPAEQVQSAEQNSVTPQAETPAGTDEQQPKEPPKPEVSAAEAARKQRNKERWEAMKQRTAESERRERYLLSEVERLSKQQPDYSKLTDPDDVLAHKTADLLRRDQIADVQRRAQDENQQRVAAVRDAWSATVEDMRTKVPDFDQVVTDSTPIHQRAAPFIVESEKGGEIAYWLGKNPDAARDLYDKFENAPAQAFIELGRIESRLSAPAAKQVSTAPKPAPVLSGGGSPAAFDMRKASVDDVAAQLKKLGLIR